jgi:light-regulated signal transduction histidine kinase (bacteriophytochrome)
MTATQDDLIAELQRANAELHERLKAALAQRNSEYGARVAHQAATIDALKAMSASPAEGTGLGLSITHDIATKAHDGTIALGSEVGPFTGFVVTLPRRMFANEETTQ